MRYQSQTNFYLIGYNQDLVSYQERFPEMREKFNTLTVEYLQQNSPKTILAKLILVVFANNYEKDEKLLNAVKLAC